MVTKGIITHINMDILNTINSLRIKLKENNIPFVTIGRFKLNVYIYVKDLAIKPQILELLSKDELSVVSIEKV